MLVDYTLTDFFFDRSEIQRRLSEAERRAMSRIGAFIRTRARSSLRRRKKVASPSQTPSVHSRDNRASLKNILFGYEPRRHTVVIGPVRLNLSSQAGLGGKTVPELHEKGGSITVHEMRFKANASREASPWFRRDPKRGIRPWQEARTRRARYPSRSFMGRALDEERKRGTITEAWRATL